MKVTEHMRALAEVVASDAGLHIDTNEKSSALLQALTAALADIPDPEQVRAEIMEELAYGRSVETQRAMVAEEKLEKVRAWRRETLESSGIAVPAWSKLDAILDSKEQP